MYFQAREVAIVIWHLCILFPFKTKYLFSFCHIAGVTHILVWRGQPQFMPVVPALHPV